MRGKAGFFERYLSGLTVSGAGTDAYNGFYVEAGTYNGKPKYEKTVGGTTYYIAFSAGGSYWVIDDSLADIDALGPVAYFRFSTAATPPLTTYGPSTEGTLPAATVS